MDQPQPKPRRLCRHLTVNGRQCQQNARRDGQFCVAHEKHRHPVCPQKGGKIVVPLLEDISAIQLVASQVAHGLFTETLDPWRAGKILYACQVAAMTVPRPAPVKTEPVRDPGPVAEVFQDLNGELLGPDLPWLGSNGRFEPTWSHDKMLYEKECERLGKPKPTCPADMPPEGWLTPEEQALPDGDTSGFWSLKLLERRIQEDQRGNLPPLEERKCSYDWGDCRGPLKGHCPYCSWERKAHELIVRGEDPMTISGMVELRRERGETDIPSRSEQAAAPSREDGDSVFIDDPEETEVLDSHKITLLNMHHCADDVGTLPPLEQRTCFYTMPDCAGPASPTPCTYCRRERDYYRKLHKGDNDLNLNASAAQERQQSGCPMSRAVRDMGQRASARLLAAAGRRRSSAGTQPTRGPVVNSVNIAKRHIPRALRNRQLYRGGPSTRNQHPCDILSGTLLMAALQEFRCEVCGTITSQPKGWWIIQCGDAQLSVLRWSTEAANASGARHYCGESHAQVYISRWFDSICTPGKPDFTGARSGRD